MSVQYLQKDTSLRIRKTEYLSLREVLEAMNFRTDYQTMQLWDWFDLPFPRGDHYVMMESNLVRDTILDAIRPELGLGITHDLYVRFGLIPNGTVVYTAEDEEIRFTVRFADGSHSEEYVENFVHRQLMDAITDRWNTVVGPYTPIDIMLDFYP